MPSLAEQLAAAKPAAPSAQVELDALAPVLAEAIAERAEYVEAVVDVGVYQGVVEGLEADGFRVAVSVEPGGIARLYVAGWNDLPKPPPAPGPEPTPAPDPALEEPV